MARKSRNRVEGRSCITKGRKLHDLEDTETEEELRRFLQEGAEFEAAEMDEAEVKEGEPVHRPYAVETEESFGRLGQFWLADN